VYQVTGQPGMLPTWPAAKVAWLARHESELFARTSKFLLLEDYFISRLTGQAVCEGSLATSTCYWDFRSRTWWPEMLAALGLDASQLPPLAEPGSAVGPLLPAVAAELGLRERTLVCTGALDPACGAIGVGNVRAGMLSENTGTPVALCAHPGRPAPRSRPADAVPLSRSPRQLHVPRVHQRRPDAALVQGRVLRGRRVARYSRRVVR
jgi:xylulokinase